MAKSLTSIRQIDGLTTALDQRPTNGANIGAGVPVFSDKTGLNMRFNTLAADATLLPLAVVDNKISFGVNVGTGAHQILQLDENAKLPAVDGSQLTGIGSGSISEISSDKLLVPDGYIIVGGSDGKGTTVAPATLGLDAFGPTSSNIDLGGFTFETALDNFATNQLVSRAYVDKVVEGFDPKPSAVAATTENIVLSGLQTVDTVPLEVGDFVLVKHQTNATENGLYVVAEGAWSRHVAMDEYPEFRGAFVFVEPHVGSVNGATGWVSSSSKTGVLGVDDIEFWQFAGAGTYSAGLGLSLTGTQFAVNTDSTLRFNGSLLSINGGALGSLPIGQGGGTIAWGKLDVSNENSVTGVLPFNHGGTGMSSYAENTVLVATAPDTLSAVVVPENTVLGRIVGGGVAPLTADDLRTFISVDSTSDVAQAVSGSMTLIALSKTPAQPEDITVTFNGLVLDQGEAWTYDAATKSIIATAALNVAYGGTGTDGLGFAATDTLKAVYFV